MQCNKYFLFVIFLFNFTIQAQHENNFSYKYSLEVAYNKQPSFELDQNIEPLANFLYSYLDQSLLFDTSFVSDPKKIRNYLFKKKYDKRFIGKPFEIYTDDGIAIECTYFNRGSNTLLIVGEGFTNYREYMSPFAAMFSEYDVVLFDFRGHGYKPFNPFDIKTWPLSLSKSTFDIEGSLVTFGKNEHLDVFAVIDGFKKLKTSSGKSYERVFGVGVCYSAFIFAKTASIYENLFDKLILDGCWLSLELFVDKIKKDLKTLFNPQTGGWSDHWLLGTPVVQNSIAWMADKVWGIQYNQNISALDFIHNIKQTELLFMYGKNDYMIKRNEFEQLWSACTNTTKTVIITSNDHVRNHWKQKELYKVICELFFEQPQNEFVECLKHSENCLHFYQQKLLHASNNKIK